MQEPSLRTSRLAIAGGLAAAVLIAGAGFLLGRTTSPGARPSAPPAPAQIEVAKAPEIPPPRILNRADIIALGNSAADALTSGKALPPDVADAAGRKFDVALPFGCSGPTPEGSDVPLGWRYDADTQALRVRAAPTRWQGGDWEPGQTGNRATSLEGFWLSRPWSSSDRCPQARGQAVAPDVQAVTLPGQTLALAEILPNDAQRRERPYETVQRTSADTVPAAEGFRLRLTGRIQRLPDGPAVRCTQPAGIEQRPICTVAVSFDEVRIENPKTSEVLATWSMRQGARKTP